MNDKTSVRERLIEVTQENTGMSRDAAQRLVRILLGTVVTHVMRHERTEIRGLGAFRWVRRRARRFKGGLFGATKVPSYLHLTFRSRAMKGARK